MKNLLNAIFLISGTAIGAGLIALPLTSVNLGMKILSLIIFFMVFVAYKTSMMTIDLNIANGKSASIVDLSRSISGKKAYVICMMSFYALSLSLIAVYSYGIANSLRAFFDFGVSPIYLISGCLLFLILNFKYSVISNLNNIFVVSLLVIIMSLVIQIHMGEGTSTAASIVIQQHPSLKEVAAFLPIIFTSFGVQNVCANVFEALNKDRKKIKFPLPSPISFRNWEPMFRYLKPIGDSLIPPYSPKIC